MSVQNQKHTFFCKTQKKSVWKWSQEVCRWTSCSKCDQVVRSDSACTHPKTKQKKKHKGRPAVMFSQAFINQLTRTMWMSHVHFLAVISVYLWEVKAMKACRAFNRTKKHVTLYLDIVLIEILAQKSLCISKKHHSTWLIRLCYKSQPSWWTCF